MRDAIKLHIEARESLGEPIPVEVLPDEVLIMEISDYEYDSVNSSF